jgi:hypothetical protein
VNAPTGLYYGGFDAWNEARDVNGDGKLDLMTYDTVGGSYGWSLYLGSGTGFTYTSHMNNPTGLYSGNLHYTNVMRDFNNDGKVDLITYDTVTGSQGWSLWLSNGTGFTYSSHLNNPTGLYYGGFDQYNGIADVNADGYLDLLTYDTVGGSYGWSLYQGSGTGFTYTSHMNNPTGLYSGDLSSTEASNLLRDMNADGKADLVTYDTVGGTYGWSVWISSGTGFTYSSHLNIPPGPSQGTAYGYLNYWNAVADANGDGKPDLFTYDSVGGTLGWSIWLGSGTAFSFLSHTNSSAGLYSGNLDTTNIVKDFNGDGRADIMSYDTVNSVYGWTVYMLNAP